MFVVEYYPPGREDSFVFFCKEAPQFHLSDESGLHTLMLSFVPTNGAQNKGKKNTIPAAHCLVVEDAASGKGK